MEHGEGCDSCVSNPNLKTNALFADAIVKKYTRSGRCIKTSEILDLLNCVSYRFECFIDPQREEGMFPKQSSKNPKRNCNELNPPKGLERWLLKVA
ncbi:hypothetical protein HNY73_019351 [Argiope bruennichi]|uniref:Uncharacterized protein n=1 Tax=Argiope bruennichi TaxID=94029 RepID=A0A8T0EKX5_ARGBR|nr:hypothetical protein HNY73_019351 [Argiope bruennichi]